MIQVPGPANTQYRHTVRYLAYQAIPSVLEYEVCGLLARSAIVADCFWQLRLSRMQSVVAVPRTRRRNSATRSFTLLALGVN